MGPYVIDSSKSKQYLGLIILALILSFVLGYSLGAKDGAPTKQQSFEELKSEIFPEKESVDKEEADKDKPSLDKPDVEKTPEPQAKPLTEKKVTGDKLATTTQVVAKSKPVVTQKPITKPEVNKEKPKPPVKKIVQTQPVKATISKPQPEAKPAPPAPIKAPAVTVTPDKPGQPSQIEAPEESVVFNMEPPDFDDDDTESESGIAPPTQVASVQSANDDSIVQNSTAYSVQVGLFTNKDYAQNFVDDLIEKGFAAYMEDFKGKDGAIKYNVRFGRSADRQLVQAQLAEYKKVFSTPAYVVINK